MQLALSIAMLAATLAHQYGYLLATKQGAIYSAFGGLWAIVGVIVITHLLWVRWKDWRAVLILAVALSISIVENSMTFVCKSWLAFFYIGPPLTGNTCTALTGLRISTPFLCLISLSIAALLLRAWVREFKMASAPYDEHSYFEAYQKPSVATPWKFLATLLMLPYAGKCWILRGKGYKYKSGKIVRFMPVISDYRLIRLDAKPNIWVGKKWALLSNCVIQK